MHTAISFFLRKVAGFSTPVLTSIVLTISVTTPGISLVPSFTKKFLLLVRTSSSIQRIVAVISVASLRSAPAARTEPLETSTSRSNWIVTGCPIDALWASLSPTWILFT